MTIVGIFLGFVKFLWARGLNNDLYGQVGSGQRKG